MTTLKPFLPINHDESLLSWAMRLAALHTGGLLIPFLKDIAVTLADLVHGADSAVSRLSEITGHDASVLRRNAPKRILRLTCELRGEHFGPDMIRDNAISFCPACLAEDDRAGSPETSRRGRLLWMFRAFRTCRKHGIPLIELEGKAIADRTQSLASAVPQRGNDLIRIADLSAKRDPSGLQTYLANRLEGVPGPAWLDGQKLGQAIRTTEMLGVALLYPHRVVLSRLSDEEWEAATGEAFPYVSAGEEGVREALRKIHSRALNSDLISGSNGPDFVFGRLYKWLTHSKCEDANGPIRVSLRQFILENMEVEPGRVLLGQLITERRLHSISTLSLKTGYHNKVLRNLLISRGILKSDKGNASLVCFDAAAGERAASLLQELVNLRALPAYMNTTRGQIEQLIEAGIIPRLAEPGMDKGHFSRGVPASAVDALLADLHRDARDVDAIPEGMRDIPGAAQVAKAPTDAIVVMIRERRLATVVRLAGQVGYNAIHIDPAEVSSAYATMRPSRPLYGSQAAERLGVTPALLNRLIKERKGVQLLKGTKAGPNFPAFIEEEDVVQFKEKYVTLFQLSKETGIHHKWLNKMLRERGIETIGDREFLKASIFLRADVPEDLTKKNV